MISIFICSSEQEELAELQKVSKDIVAQLGDERLDITTYSLQKNTEFPSFDCMDVAFVDITERGGLEMAKCIRKQFARAEIVIISDKRISPVMYLTPDIRAASLIMKPFVYKEMFWQLEKVFQTLNLEEEESGGFLLLKEKDEKIRIPYSRILYFEYRDKRIHIRLQSREYGMYGTMEELVQMLPVTFRRCHRSFIVNMNYISRIRYAKNKIVLKDEIEIPLSRSYKLNMKEIIRDESESK
ncbi:MAG: LytTR family DNA-binding domain-containing protein [Bacteroidales bacterium]|nr:LytTR family DNA-binding domain-containing protein [Clostridium sp.]MCM1204256.1 LytTR family DNA-binding domain-containing protein [Bacteroidales bacterium]